MKKLLHPKVKKSKLLLCTIVLLLFIGSCAKDNFKENDQEPKKTLTENSSDLKIRLDEIKRNFYLRKLDNKLKTNIDENLIWTPEWDNPRVQTINDSVSYVFYPLIGHILKDGKLLKAEESGAKSYIIVKNEKYYFRGKYYQPNNHGTIKSNSKLNEINTKNFTGKLFLSNLEVKENYIIDYKDGAISEEYRKNGERSLKKLQSNKGAISFFENYCHTEMKSCTYYTYFQSCGGSFIIEYSYDCQQPSYCQNSIWILSDYNIEEVCESVWFPDPPEPIDPGNGSGTSGTAEYPPLKVDVDPNARPCLAQIKAQLEALGLKNTSTSAGLIASVLNKLNLSNGSNFNAIINERAISSNFIAQTTEITNSNTYGTQGTASEITFNSNILNNMTDLAVAATMMHEYVHAYFDWNFHLIYRGEATYDADFISSYNLLFKDGSPNSTPDTHHDQMAKSFASSISTMLKQYADAKNISYPADPEYFNKMGWIGLMGTDAAKYAPTGTAYTLNAETNSGVAHLSQALNCKK